MEEIQFKEEKQEARTWTKLDEIQVIVLIHVLKRLKWTFESRTRKSIEKHSILLNFNNANLKSMPAREIWMYLGSLLVTIFRWLPKLKMGSLSIIPQVT